MNHSGAPATFDKNATAAVDGLLQNPTVTTVGVPKSSSESIVVVDDAHYLAPCKFDVLVTDITADYLVRDLSSLLEVQYLSRLPKDEELARYKKQKSSRKDYWQQQAIPGEPPLSTTCG